MPGVPALVMVKDTPAKAELVHVVNRLESLVFISALFTSTSSPVTYPTTESLLLQYNVALINDGVTPNPCVTA